MPVLVEAECIVGNLTGYGLSASKVHHRRLVRTRPQLEPKPKTISPGIHVCEHAFTPESFDLICEKNLQVTNSVFFSFVAAGIGIKLPASCWVKANEMAGLVQDGVNWGVITGV